MKLYFKDIELGQITEVSANSPWIYGTIHLNENSKPFHEYFRGMVDEEIEIEFDFEVADPEFLAESNWSILDENEGKYLGIDIPAI
ncbi:MULTISPECIES: hypothetical protein [Bacillus cereus group]|uniref:Group-specific protein n=1 Tax=Bacillus cereus TaxID=1396 RepID=A0AA44TEM8_BACCE|nr:MULTISPECIES: hypothetical protein [Bacillus cereus group]EEL51854.1 hypothetical protein bcere0022_7680 [Bacillus cereus Rock3-44]PFN06945.1 hypothetical protein COJ55_12505 [Bacillus cereus]PFR27687.1 hypothetical protein COK19_09965 [Bacillus cereus]PFS01099.1 hypothetical protein COK38_12405 [Bacillus cereus]